MLDFEEYIKRFELKVQIQKEENVFQVIKLYKLFRGFQTSELFDTYDINMF